MNKPFAASCQQNREPIFNIIQPLLKNCQTLLEIGSGTGQHAVYFANKLPHLHWQTSDRANYHAGINAWLDDANHPNILPPLLLDVSQNDCPKQRFDAIFSANTLHIMSKEEVIFFFQKIASCLSSAGSLIVYGPFNYDGNYTSDSNARFDQWLISQNSHSSIKDFEWINDLAKQAGLTLKKDYAMPANNRILHWEKNPHNIDRFSDK
jgi:cyclopropane fatty-acyl-phospholipid synthase-like methyltransferase